MDKLNQGINPFTGRRIKIDGKVYKQVLNKVGKIHNLDTSQQKLEDQSTVDELSIIQQEISETNKLIKITNQDCQQAISLISQQFNDQIREITKIMNRQISNIIRAREKEAYRIKIIYDEQIIQLEDDINQLEHSYVKLKRRNLANSSIETAKRFLNPTIPRVILSHQIILHANYIYFIRESGTNMTKIGMTNQSRGPKQRLKELQTGNPRKLIVSAQLLTFDTSQAEKNIHALLLGKHVRGEWFELTLKEISEFIYDKLSEFNF